MPNPLSNPRHRATVITLVVAIVAGWVFARLGSPLPWMIGPLLVCAAINVATGKLYSPRTFRKGGQWIIGLALGLYFSADVLAKLAQAGGLIAAGIAWAVLLGFLLAVLMQRLARMDWPTAFFASAIGGASEMMMQAERQGGVGASVAAAHSVRILLVVVTIPFLYRALDLHGTDPYHPAAREVHGWGLAGLLVLTGAGGLLAQRLRSPNGWMIGPLLVSIMLTASGQHWSAVPGWLTVSGQVAIGMTLGTRFTPAFRSSATRTVIASAIVTVVAMVLSGGFGWLLGVVSGIAPATMILATAPGGITEMSLTARNLELGVPMVVAFHAARMAFLVLAIGAIYRWTARIRV